MRHIFYEINQKQKNEIIKSFSLNGLIKVNNDFVAEINYKLLDDYDNVFYLIIEKKYYKLVKKVLINKNIKILTTEEFNNLKISDICENENESNFLYLFKDNFLINDLDSIFIHESKRKNLGFWYQKNLLINCIYLENNICDEKISKCFKKNKYKKINLASKSIYLISSFEKLQAIDERYLSFDNDIVFTPGPTSILSSTKKILCYGITHHRTETGILAIKTCAKMERPLMAMV